MQTIPFTGNDRRWMPPAGTGAGGLGAGATGLDAGTAGFEVAFFAVLDAVTAFALLPVAAGFSGGVFGGFAVAAGTKRTPARSRTAAVLRRT
jgi:hypothetical protein